MHAPAQTACMLHAPAAGPRPEVYFTGLSTTIGSLLVAVVRSIQLGARG